MTEIAALVMTLVTIAANPLNAEEMSYGDTSHLDKISLYQGTWSSSFESFDTDYSKPHKKTSVISNECWRSAEYVACHQSVDGKSGALIVYTYKQNDDVYHLYTVPKDGSPVNAPGTLIIKGDTWTFPWDISDKGKVVHFRIVNVWSAANNSIEFTQEYSFDNVNWIVAAKGTENRQKP